MPSIAMVITAKNERVLLRQNILFHRYLGIEKFYVFLDNSTDDTCETVTDSSLRQSVPFDLTGSLSRCTITTQSRGALTGSNKVPGKLERIFPGATDAEHVCGA